MVDPMHWWGALTSQFQQIAANALKDAAKQTGIDPTHNVATGLAWTPAGGDSNIGDSHQWSAK